MRDKRKNIECIAWTLFGVFCLWLGVRMLLWPPSRFGGGVLTLLGCCCGAEAYFVSQSAKSSVKRMVACVGRSLFLLFISSFLVVQGVILQGMQEDAQAHHANVILVLGARVYMSGTPSATLIERLDVANAYLQANPNAMAVLCGGQGENEPCPEAVAMQRYLVRQGVDAERLLLEAASNNTIQNIANAKAMLERNHENYTTAVISSDFHLARARKLMEHAGLDAYAIPAHTPYVTQRISLHIREYASIMGLVLTGRW